LLQCNFLAASFLRLFCGILLFLLGWERGGKEGGGSPACIISIPHLLLIIFWFSRFDCCFCCLQLQLQSMQIQNRQKEEEKCSPSFAQKMH